MRRLRALLERLSLRDRFLIAPLAGLALLAVLTGAFLLESNRQGSLLGRVAERDMAAFDRYFRIHSEVSAQHMALYGLLNGAESVDEEAIYDRAKERIEAIYAAIAELERAAVELRAPRGQEIDGEPLEAALLARTREYRRSAAQAVEMSTVDVRQAARRLVEANERFLAMSRAFSDMLETQQHAIGGEISDQTRQARRNVVALALAGLSLAVLLLALSIVLARYLSRALVTQIEALSETAREAGGSLAVEGGNEIEKIGNAVAAFRGLHLCLRENEIALAAANERLEERVGARTRELSAANASLRLYAEAVRSTGEGIVVANAERSVVEVNPAYERMTGASRDALIGRALFPAVAGHPGGNTHIELWQGVESQGHWTGEILERRAGGETFPAWAMVNAVRGERGEVAHYVGVLRDITVLKQSEQQLKKLAFHDPLTGLANRALFSDRLGMALAQAERQGAGLALLCIDLDDFKQVNDTLGHAAGDRLLAEVAQRIVRCVRASDTVARLGGDEFAVLMTRPGTEAEASRVAERIIDAVRAPVLLGGETAHVGASIGLAFRSREADTAETLHRHADLAMYEAKRAGRGQLRAFSRDMLERGAERMSLSVEIESALVHDEFLVHYQPIFDFATGHVEGVEALIRWRKPDGRWISPGSFIPHAEEAGIIRRIDAWVLERACTDAARWFTESGEPLYVCVNLSAVSIQQRDTALLVRDVLERTGLPSGLLRVEITETAVIAAPAAALAVLESIAALGVGLSLDDFGTGYSSLNYLTQFPIQTIKLDRAFVAAIGKERASEEVIRSLLQLAQRLRLQVVAEGIEEAGQQAFLRSWGCRYAQGYLLAKPMPEEEMLPWLAEHRKAKPRRKDLRAA